MNEATKNESADAVAGQVQRVVMPRCRTCGHWQEGTCSRLSSTVPDGECSPKPRDDALITAWPMCVRDGAAHESCGSFLDCDFAWPVCVRDGAAVEFETDSDFGCVHHTDLG